MVLEVARSESKFRVKSFYEFHSREEIRNSLQMSQKDEREAFIKNSELLPKLSLVTIYK